MSSQPPPQPQAGPQRGSRTVFVGNIAFDVTEEQLISVFKEVGPVASFRLVFDRDTGKPKGYGFCEFYDAETAQSAVRNLARYEIGGRELRVDFSEAPADASVAPPTSRHHVAANSQPASFSVPPGTSLATGKSATDAITQLLVSMTSQQLTDVLLTMKTMIQTNPEQARQLMTQQPQLSYALFQALLMMQLVPKHAVQHVIKQAAGAQTAPIPAATPVPNVAPFPNAPNTAAAVPQVAPLAGYFAPPAAGPGYAPGPVPYAAPPGAPGYAGYRPMPGPVPSAPPNVANHPPNAPFPAPSLSHLSPEQQHFLTQVMNMTPQQIDALPADKRASLLAVKAQFLARSSQ